MIYIDVDIVTCGGPKAVTPFRNVCYWVAIDLG